MRIGRTPSKGTWGALAAIGIGLFIGCTGEEHLGPVPIQKSEIKILPSRLDLDALAEIGQLRAQRTDGQGRPSNLNRFVWRSLDPDIVQIDGAGRVISVSQGTATIEVSASGDRARAKVQVDQVPVLFAVSPREDTLQAIGQRRTLSFEARDKNGFRVPRNTVQWRSADARVVSVDEQGTVTARAEGDVRIFASKRGRSDSSQVKVRRGKNIITIEPGLDTLKALGAQVQMTATATDADGNTTQTSGFNWTSSDPSVASVDQNGVVTAHAEGNADITASDRGRAGWAQIVVEQMVETVDIDPANTSLGAPEQAVQLTASGLDAEGHEVPGSSFTWSSDRPGVADVDDNGLVTAKGSGTAQIAATASNGAKGFATVGVGEIDLNVTPSADTIPSLNDSTHLAIYPKDANGQDAECPNPSWRSTETGVATVNSVGRVIGHAAGTALIVVAACAVEDTASIWVELGGGGGAPPPSESWSRPELPRAIPDTVRPTATRTVRATTAAELQSAIDNAVAGDEILLTPGTTYSRSQGFTLPARNDGGWVTIRGDMPSVAKDVRVDSTLNFPVLTCTGTVCSTVSASEPGDHGWRFETLEITGGWDGTTAMVALHPSPATDVINRMVFDRVYVHAGDPNWDLRRCFMANVAGFALLRSVVTECHQRGFDSQAVLVWNTPGPILIYENLLEGSSENFMSGGAGISGASNVPQDITFARNHVRHPKSWHGGPWVIKNLFELKSGFRIHIWGNVFENHWRDGQHGPSIVLKSSPEAQDASFAPTAHVTFERNILRNVDMGFSLNAGIAEATPLKDVLIENVIIEKLGPNGDYGDATSRTFQILGPHNLTIRNITSINPGVHTSVEVTDVSGENLLIENMLHEGSTAYGLRNRAISQWYGSTYTFTANYAVGDNCGNYSGEAGWSCPTTRPTGVGADKAAVDAATAGVVR